MVSNTLHMYRLEFRQRFKMFPMQISRILSLTPSCLVMWPANSGHLSHCLQSVSLQFLRTTELCLRSRKSLLTGSSPHVQFPSHSDHRSVLPGVQCLKADVSYRLYSFLIVHDEKLSASMAILWWEEESSVFKH